jgi:hypothetical protein
MQMGDLRHGGGSSARIDPKDARGSEADAGNIGSRDTLIEYDRSGLGTREMCSRNLSEITFGDKAFGLINFMALDPFSASLFMAFSAQ